MGLTDGSVGRLEAQMHLEQWVCLSLFLLLFLLTEKCLLLDYVYGSHEERPQIPTPRHITTTATTTIRDASSRHSQTQLPSITTHHNIDLSTLHSHFHHYYYDHGEQGLGARDYMS
jgi:hypothetical protein